MRKCFRHMTANFHYYFHFHSHLHLHFSFTLSHFLLHLHFSFTLSYFLLHLHFSFTLSHFLLHLHFSFTHTPAGQFGKSSCFTRDFITCQNLRFLQVCSSLEKCVCLLLAKIYDFCKYVRLWKSLFVYLFVW